jgi:hypothetical protein
MVKNNSLKVKKHYLDLFSCKNTFKKSIITTLTNTFYIFISSVCVCQNFFAFTLYYNGYDDLTEKNLLENLFGIVVIIIFLNDFCLEMHQNNIYIFVFF